MQQTSSSGADLSDHEIARVIKRAELARAQFLHDHGRSALKAIGASASVLAFAFLLVLGAGSPRHQILQNTVVMERLATNLARARTIPPQTVGELAQLLRRPDYDCRQLTCETWLQKRNLDARSRLQTVLTRTTLQADAAGGR